MQHATRDMMGRWEQAVAWVRAGGMVSREAWNRLVALTRASGDIRPTVG